MLFYFCKMDRVVQYVHNNLVGSILAICIEIINITRISNVRPSYFEFLRLSLAKTRSWDWKITNITLRKVMNICMVWISNWARKRE